MKKPVTKKTTSTYVPRKKYTEVEDSYKNIKNI